MEKKKHHHPKKHSPKKHHASRAKKEDKKEIKIEKKIKKLSRKNALVLTALFFVFLIVFCVHIYLNFLYKNSWLTEYKGSCFIRTYQNWTGRNTVPVYQIIPSDTKTQLLPALPITINQFEELGWKVSNQDINQICNANVTLYYSLWNLKVEGLVIQ